MTLSTTNARDNHTATAGQTIFPYTFQIFAATDMQVYSGNDLIISGYTVTNVGDPNGGNVEFTEGRIAGERISLISAIPQTQLTDFTAGGILPATTIETSDDRLMRVAHQITELVSRIPRLDINNSHTLAGLNLPHSETAAYLGWNSNGSGLTTYSVLSDGEIMFPAAPGALDDYSGNVGQMQTITSPGDVGSESLATSLAGELERLRYVLEDRFGSRWYQPERVWVNVRSPRYGAVGDGVTDDTTAIQNAFIAAGASDSPILLPPGIYRITSTLTVPDTLRLQFALRGAGRNLTQIAYEGTGALLMLDGSATPQTSSRRQFWRIEGLSLVGPGEGEAGTIGLHLNNGLYGCVSDVLISDFETGVVFDAHGLANGAACYYNQAYQLDVFGCVDGIVFEEATNSNQIHGGSSRLNTGWGVKILSGQTFLTNNVLLFGITLESNTAGGLWLDGTGNAFIGGRLENNGAPEVHINKSLAIAPQGSGTATAGAATTLTDSTQTWTVNAFVGDMIVLTGGTGAGQSRRVASNTATQISVGSNAWVTAPDATTTYEIRDAVAGTKNTVAPYFSSFSPESTVQDDSVNQNNLVLWPGHFHLGASTAVLSTAVLRASRQVASDGEPFIDIADAYAESGAPIGMRYRYRRHGSLGVQVQLDNGQGNVYTVLQTLTNTGSGKSELWFGASTSAAVDTNLYRDAANVLKTDDAFVAGAGLTIAAGSLITNHLTATAALNFGSISAQTTAELTITVTGAAAGDTVIVTPSVAPDAGLVWSGYVSASNTVTVRLGNMTAGAIDPASQTWRVDVWRH